jgi:GNAT superfamily N-acetyltransferase
MHKQYAPMPQYYLTTIGVRPEAQGKGVASKLIKPFIAQAEREGCPVYTETITPQNVSLYQHYGFKVMEQYSVPRTDLNLWSFLTAR